MTCPTADQIQLIHRDGIAAIVDLANSMDQQAWTNPTPCDGWNAKDLAGHLVAVTSVWHQTLDDAEQGRTEPRWTFPELEDHLERQLRNLPDTSGPNRIQDFAEAAHSWLDRVLVIDPSLLVPHPVQYLCAVPLTTARLAWMAGMEWHIHAWDLAQAMESDYRSDHAGSILEALVAVRGIMLPDTVDPWTTLLGMFRPR